MMTNYKCAYCAFFCEYIGTTMMAIVYIAIVVIIIILSYWRWRAATAQLNEQFIGGFWSADQADCDTKGYKEAFLYIEKGGASYILAMPGAGGATINCPFKLYLNNYPYSSAIVGKCVAKDFAFDAHIKCDMARGTMTWDTPNGDHIFTWIKNCDMSRKVASI